MTAGESGLTIDFAHGKIGQEMDPISRTKKLEILDKDDLIVRFQANPEEIREQLKKFLQQYGDQTFFFSF
jgi:hypothetical protein